jgi:hypothetical protein
MVVGSQFQRRWIEKICCWTSEIVLLMEEVQKSIFMFVLLMEEVQLNHFWMLFYWILFAVCSYTWIGAFQIAALWAMSYSQLIIEAILPSVHHWNARLNQAFFKPGRRSQSEPLRQSWLHDWQKPIPVRGSKDSCNGDIWLTWEDNGALIKFVEEEVSCVCLAWHVHFCFMYCLMEELASLRALEKDEPVSCRDKSMCRLWSWCLCGYNTLLTSMYMPERSGSMEDAWRVCSTRWCPAIVASWNCKMPWSWDQIALQQQDLESVQHNALSFKSCAMQSW